MTTDLTTVLPGPIRQNGYVVRDLDVMATPWPPHEHRFVVGNRGLAGIDGTVSTAIGIALGRDGASRTIAYLGDLTLLHDTNGLLIGPLEPQPDLTVVVVNDDGGGIFTLLEPGDPERAADFERVFGTPTGSDLAALCAAHGVPHEVAETREALAKAVAERPGGLRVILAVARAVTTRATAPMGCTTIRGENLRLVSCRSIAAPSMAVPASHAGLPRRACSRPPPMLPAPRPGAGACSSTALCWKRVPRASRIAPATAIGMPSQ